ncbi:carboxypeptidase inhibitor SmCI-like [Dermacentor silvarum]|uniref:carboxypeptidase inhibitor SmCI-like n=1 Tax=Dermacentor silvarum TaxID=543639 RepID=UPI0018990CB2|nr:carboxypeptidase inhibitor SmCI-like [Dermacentor silvarum]
MRLARCTLLIFFMAGLCLVSSEVDYSEEQWKTRYAPLKCEKPPKIFHKPTKYQLWFYNVTATKCEPFFSKTNIQHGNSFGSKKACNEFCRDKHYGMCATAKNESLCWKHAEPRFWFNPDTRKCEMFRYGGCDPNSNVFRTMFECIQECAEFMDEICNLPIDEGNCLWKEVRFGYNPSFRACEAFNYTGCGGNRNNFKSAHSCLMTCARDSRCLKHTEENFAFFRLIVTYFYDAVKNECRPTRTFFRKSAAPKYNRFLTKAECERVCMRKHIPRFTFQ